MTFFNFRKILIGIIGLFITAFFIWQVFGNFNFVDLETSLLNLDPSFLIFSIITIYISYLLRIYRWKLLTTHKSSNLSWLSFSGPYMASYALNNILPFRVGDFARIFYFNKYFNLTSGQVTGFMIVERVFDLVVIIILFLFSIFFFNIIENGISFNFLLIPLFLILILSIIFFNPNVLNQINRINTNLISFFSKEISNFIFNYINEINLTLISFRKKKILIKLVFLTILSWMFEAFVYLFIALAIPIKCNIINSFIVFPVSTLSTMIPSAPGYIGTFHYSIVKSLEFLNCNIVEATIMAVIIHFIIWISAILWGILYLFSIIKIKPFSSKKDAS